jgi:hypothetical protein
MYLALTSKTNSTLLIESGPIKSHQSRVIRCRSKLKITPKSLSKPEYLEKLL